MRKRLVITAILLLALFGLNPWVGFHDADTVLAKGYSGGETGVERLPNGVYLVRALTRMPEVNAEMVRWWFADYLQTTAHYKRWHPTAHVWMDWENKKPGIIVGASHLVHEYIGDELQQLRLQFVPPSQILGDFEAASDRFVICARVGLLEEPLNITSMCHIVRNTDWGAEMRSIFWLGHVGRRDTEHDNNAETLSIEALMGNTAIARMVLVNRALAVDLMQHAVEEMGYLADFLPELYLSETGD